AAHIEPGRAKQADEVARRHRAEQLTRLRGLTEHRKALSVDRRCDLPGFTLERERARGEFALHGFEAGAVLLGGAQRLAARQKEIAREAVLDAHDFAHLAQPRDSLQQDHVHLGSPWRLRRPLLMRRYRLSGSR